MINIKELKPSYNITLHKVNKELIADFDMSFIEKITRDISGIDSIEISVPKYITDRNGLGKIKFITYDEVKYERFISLDQNEFFVIKSINEKGLGMNKVKKVVAYSLEKKLTRQDIEVEDIGFYLIGKDEEKSILSLNDYMYQETGWTFGHIDDSVRYDILENGEKQEKLRWQESILTNWHDFLTNNIREAFECVVQFDSGKKEVNLYDIDSFGDEVVLSLSYDNFLRDLEKQGSTDELVTRMKLVGSEDVDILEETVTGYPYIEDFSYFIDSDDMSTELKNALLKYEDMVTKRTVTWKELIAQKLEKQKQLTENKDKLTKVLGEMTALQGEINAYNSINDIESKAIAVEKLTKKKDEFVIIDTIDTQLENEIILLQESILNINTLCKRETCTDDNGVLIFNQDLLDELKEFVYCETYTNDSFLKVSDLIKAGQRNLELKCRPTSTWSIDSVNFMQRLRGIRYRKQVNFNIGLGNVVELCSGKNDIEELTYFTGFTQDFKSGNLTLILSNKKLTDSNIRVIGDKLFKAEKATRAVEKNRYLWIQQKKNRINLSYSKGK